MNEFTRKTLLNNGLGAKLRAARELRQIDLEQAARKLNIRLEYLKAIEEDHLGALPSGLYKKNYIKKYAALLGFSSIEVSKWLNENLDTINDLSDPFSQKILRKKEFIVFPKLIRNTGLIIIFLICLFYLAFYFKKIIFPPELIIYQPNQNLKTSERFIEIKGSTDKEAEVSINGDPILNTNEGNFSTTINLKQGVNNITIKAKKKYSQEALVLRQILVE